MYYYVVLYTYSVAAMRQYCYTFLCKQWQQFHESFLLKLNLLGKVTAYWVYALFSLFSAICSFRILCIPVGVCLVTKPVVAKAGRKKADLYKKLRHAQLCLMWIAGTFTSTRLATWSQLPQRKRGSHTRPCWKICHRWATTRLHNTVSKHSHSAVSDFPHGVDMADSGAGRPTLRLRVPPSHCQGLVHHNKDQESHCNHISSRLPTRDHTVSAAKSFGRKRYDAVKSLCKRAFARMQSPYVWLNRFSAFKKLFVSYYVVSNIRSQHNMFFLRACSLCTFAFCGQ